MSVMNGKELAMMTKDPMTDLAASVESDGIAIEIAPGLTRIMTWRELWTAMRALKNVTTAEGQIPGLADLDFSKYAKEHWGETACMFQRMAYSAETPKKP